MHYLIHHANELHSSPSYNHLKSLGGSKTNAKVLYYLITFYIFTILVFTFEIPLIYRITNTIESILLSHLLYFFGALIGFLFFYAIRIKTSVSTLFRITMVFNILLSIYLIIFYSKITSLSLILPLFALRGLGVASFAIGFHTSFITGIKDKQRDSFSLLFRSIYTVLPVFLPLLGGYIISNFNFSFFPSNQMLPDGYYPLFILGLILGIIFLIFSPTIKLSEDFSGGIKTPIKLLFNKKIRSIRNYLIFNAGVDGLKVAIYGLLGFLILTNELSLGLFSSALALLGSIYFLLINKVEKKFHIRRIGFFVVGLFGDVLTQLVLLVDTTFIGLLIRSIASTLLTPLKAVFGTNMIRHKYDVYSKELNVSKSSFILFQEMSYFIGRLIAFSFILLLIRFVATDMTILLKYSLVLFIVVDILEYFFIKDIK